MHLIPFSFSRITVQLIHFIWHHEEKFNKLYSQLINTVGSENEKHILTAYEPQFIERVEYSHFTRFHMPKYKHFKCMMNVCVSIFKAEMRVNCVQYNQHVLYYIALYAHFIYLLANIVHET